MLRTFEANFVMNRGIEYRMGQDAGEERQ